MVPETQQGAEVLYSLFHRLCHLLDKALNSFPAPAGEPRSLFLLSLWRMRTFALSPLRSCGGSWALGVGTWALSWCLSSGTLWELALLLSATDSCHNTITTADWAFSDEQLPHKSAFCSISPQPNPEQCCYPAFASPLIPMQFHTAHGKLPICVKTQPPGKTASKVQLPGAKLGKASGESGPDAKAFNACRDISAPHNILLSRDGHCCPDWPCCPLCPGMKLLLMNRWTGFPNIMLYRINLDFPRISQVLTLPRVHTDTPQLLCIGNWNVISNFCGICWYCCRCLGFEWRRKKVVYAF